MFLAVMIRAGGLTSIAASAEPSLLGKKAPDWDALTWIDSAPRSLANLAGKVVLIRWWTAPHCP